MRRSHVRSVRARKRYRISRPQIGSGYEKLVLLAYLLVLAVEYLLIAEYLGAVLYIGQMLLYHLVKLHRLLKLGKKADKMYILRA